MKRYLIFILILTILIALVAVLYYFYETNKNQNVLILYGNVDVRQVDTGFRVAGQVETLCFEEGDMVPQGSLLATLNKTPYDSQVTQAQATLSAVKVTLQNAEILLKRRQELIGISGVSQEDLDNAQSTYNQLLSNFQQSEAALQVAKDNLSFTEIFAPTAGIILTRIREPGSVVKESDPVYTLSITSPVWIRAFVAEPELGKIYYGMEAEIFTDTPGGKVYTGRIGFISPVAEFTPKTVETTHLRTDLVYRLRIYAENPDQFLKQGMPVTVRLRLTEKAKDE